MSTIAFRRLVNLGNYEHAAVEMTATLEPGDLLLTSLHELVWMVTQGLAEILGEDQVWRLGDSDAAKLRTQGKVPAIEPADEEDDIPL